MNANENRLLPNAADKATLEAIATTVVAACPSLHDTAHEVASDLLANYKVVGLDPDHVFFHRFKTAQSSGTSFTGWQHFRERPYESMTLTQLVIHRFRATDQDNADLLDLYAGFYTAGPEADDFNETNEVRLHGSQVLNDFWRIDFNSLYRNKLQTFWTDHADDFRVLAKCNFLGKAVQARDTGHLTDTDFQTVVSAVIGPLTWPISLQTLRSEHTIRGELSVGALDVAGHVATDIVRISAANGRQIVYVPGETESFQVLETPSDLHWWVLMQMNREVARRQFLNHFPMATRQAITENITDLMNQLVETWGHSDHQLINQANLAVAGDAFGWLRDSTRTAMFNEADLSLTSNTDLRKKLWIGYLSAGLKAFGPMAAVGWPIALPVIGASLASMGLNIDQAVNAKTSAERKQGVTGAILSGIETLLNLPFLKGVGAEAEVAETVETIQPLESLPPDEPLPFEEGEAAALPVEELATVVSEPPPTTEIPQKFESNELLDGHTPITEPGKYQGIYLLDSDPPHAIVLNDKAYYVRYFKDSQGGGFWAIVDPARPNQLVHSLPVRLNAEGQWQRMTRLLLKGGGQCMGKECVVELEMQPLDAPPAEPQPAPPTQPTPTPTPEVAPQPGPSSAHPKPPFTRRFALVRTQYEVDPQSRFGLKKWALDLPQTHFQPMFGLGGELVWPDRYALYCAAGARDLINTARVFFRNLNWAHLPARPPLPPITSATTITDLIAGVFQVAPGLVIGETLGRITSMRFMIENMALFARQGVKTLYVRRLLNDFAQAELDSYFRTGTLSDDLETYLTQLGSDPAGQFGELQLVKSARENGIRVQATDCAATFRKTILNSRIDEQMGGTHLTADIMALDKTLNGVDKWVVLTSPEHLNTFRGVPGISELEGGIGLRIEEVDVGEGQRIELDPGVDIDRGPFPQPESRIDDTDRLLADLRLQMEAPAVVRNGTQLSRLLHRPGMYLFERAGGTYTLVHRSTAFAIVRTPVEVMEDGGFRIDRPTWPRVHHVRFDSLSQLARGLDQSGLHMQSRLPT